MRRVRIRVSIASHDWSFSPQEEVTVGTSFHSANETHPGEIPADVADIWCAVGHAEPIADEVIESAAVEAPETAALPRVKKRRG